LTVPQDGGWPSVSYDGRSLSGLLPSVLEALGVPGCDAPLGLEPTSRACVFLVDGLGLAQLLDHAEHAPYLSGLVADADPGRAALSAGFPATTATSMGSLGTGLPPGSHGLLGYELAIPGSDRVLNALRWDLDAVDPLAWQPRRTVFERAADAGVATTRIGPAFFERSGLTVAAMRGGTFLPAESEGERIAAAVDALRTGDRAFVYAYYGDLDATGHRTGVGSRAWRLQLELVDRMVAQLAERLPRGATLLVTADHGMVDVPADKRFDLALDHGLADGVRVLAGEARARYVHTRDGATDDVLAAWRERLGDVMWVLSREEAVAAGWFGPQVPERSLARIGDVVAAARAPVAVVDSARERPELLRLVGLHGSLTESELTVPLLEVRA
jgi:hypothetical protein